MEKCYSNVVSEVQREHVIPKVVSIDFRDFDDLVQNALESEPVDESVIRGHGWLGYLGDRKWRTEAENRVYRKRDYDGAIFGGSDVDVRREDGERLEEDTAL